MKAGLSLFGAPFFATVGAGALGDVSFVIFFVIRGPVLFIEVLLI
jgi:hypothetical protein